MFFNFKCKRALLKVKKLLSLPVSNVMTNYVVTVLPKTTIISAATRMIAEGVSCLIVFDEKPLGIITERDFLKKVPPTSNALKLKVKDIMTKKIFFVSSKQTITEAYNMMKTHGFRKVVVIDDNDVVGIVTQSDIVKLFSQVKYFVPKKELVSNWMTKKIISINVSSTFSSAKALMVKKNIGALLLTDKKKYKGIFTEYDVVAQFYDQGGLLSIKSPKQIMKSHIKSVLFSVDIFSVNKLMLKENVRRLLVVKDNNIVGVITQTDVARGIFELLNNMLKINYCKSLNKINKNLKIESTFINDNIKLYQVFP